MTNHFNAVPLFPTGVSPFLCSSTSRLSQNRAHPTRFQ